MHHNKISKFKNNKKFSKPVKTKQKKNDYLQRNHSYSETDFSSAAMKVRREYLLSPK